MSMPSNQEGSNAMKLKGIRKQMATRGWFETPWHLMTVKLVRKQPTHDPIA
jgi:hypothetical protein